MCDGFSLTTKHILCFLKWLSMYVHLKFYNRLSTNGHNFRPLSITDLIFASRNRNTVWVCSTVSYDLPPSLPLKARSCPIYKSERSVVSNQNWLRGMELNHLSSGYEPDMLPLHYPAISIVSTLSHTFIESSS